MNQLQNIFSHYTRLSFPKKSCSLHYKRFYKHPLFTTHLLVITMDEVFNISEKYQPPSNIPNQWYLYTRHFVSLFHFKKKIDAVYRKWFSKHSCFTTFSLFLTVSEACNISNNYWLANKSAKKLLHGKATPLLHFKKITCSPSPRLLETSTFYDIFINFHSGWGVQFFK